VVVFLIPATPARPAREIGFSPMSSFVQTLDQRFGPLTRIKDWLPQIPPPFRTTKEALTAALGASRPVANNATAGGRNKGHLVPTL